MSTFGTAVVIDVPVGADLPAAARFLAPWSGIVYGSKASDGWQRATTYLAEPEKFDVVVDGLRRIDTARAAVAEDFDEYGALWAVLDASHGQIWTVHRRYVLNADPDDFLGVAMAVGEFDGDPRTDDVAGETAAAEAAKLFGVEPAGMIEAERDSHRAFEDIGVVGGPFPWWGALELEWPGPKSGDPLF